MTITPTRRGLLLAGALALPALRHAEAQAPSAPQGASLAAMVARANAGTVGVVSGGVDGTYIRIAADLAAVLDDGERLRVLPIIGRGSVQNISDIMFVRGVDIGIVQSDALAYVRSRRMFPGVAQMIQYITKLYDEEVHVLVRAGIGSVQDLAGQRVNVDVTGSGTAMTASLIFEALGIAPEFVHDPQDTALERLKRGEIAALVYVAGKPARLFGGLTADAGLRFLPLPMAAALMETYLPSRLTHEQYPALIPEDAPVETLAVGAVMAVYAWAPGTERFRKVAGFVDALHSRFERFLQPPRHPKWREVNLEAQVPGWVRFNSAQEPPPRGGRP
ncbi:TAXI family TRAP transporter solute-binding subunit [Roseomonas sp. SSH11]|uniref:TAXI family TRAP transporter solute-binding subunit n=1 Tax=Pararoseomonas baculiformis TaxID=2820812 RepID=A0ABS4ADR4_9PROT|nr:TAXI family TRAP transporter solute-binding subunit [Pararoseomonas baculiformis]MBP0444653.1 TAXI family TRAP transporter solute-binding subunit [Pararoseomonas baculiformis]